MEQRFPEFLSLAHRMLEECRVRPDERVVLYTDTTKPTGVVEAFHAAAGSRARDTLLVIAPTAPTCLQDPPPAAVRAMVEADFVLDMATWFWTYTPAVNEILQSGTRILQVYGDGIAVLDRPPDEAISARVAWATEHLVRASRTVRIKTAKGTDFECSIDPARNVFFQDGRAEVPGDWDSIGGGMVNFSPPEVEAAGTLVVDGTCFLPPQHAFVVKEHVRLDVEGGRIVRVGRDTEEGRLVDEWLRSWNDPSVNVISHVGVGLDHRATLAEDDLLGWEGHMGSALIAFGANTITRFSGRNWSPTHMDTTILEADMWFDDRQAVAKGELLPAELRR